MPKPDPARLKPATYPHRDIIQTRFQDLDPLGHLNNVAIAALFETGRVRFNQATGMIARRERRWLVANVTIDYLAEGRMADVTMASGIARIGTRSWTIAQAAFQGESCIATCDTALVLEAAADAIAIPDALRAELERWMLAQS